LLAQFGNPRAQQLVSRMSLVTLLNAADEVDDPDHAAALNGLVKLAIQGRFEAEDALQSLFEYNPQVAVEMSLMVDDPRFPERGYLRMKLQQFSLRALEEVARVPRHPLQDKAIQALIHLIPSDSPHPLASRALAEAWGATPEAVQAAFQAQRWALSHLFNLAREGDKAGCLLLDAVAR